MIVYIQYPSLKFSTSMLGGTLIYPVGDRPDLVEGFGDYGVNGGILQLDHNVSQKITLFRKIRRKI